jgi:hypothetical protein
MSYEIVIKLILILINLEKYFFISNFKRNKVRGTIINAVSFILAYFEIKNINAQKKKLITLAGPELVEEVGCQYCSLKVFEI